MPPDHLAWDGDEKLYQPRIHSQRIRALHQISEGLGEPMTVLVDRALTQFIDVYWRVCHEEWLEAVSSEQTVQVRGVPLSVRE
jgi:hypothetical protein